jgi:hypothetical protein
MEFARLKTENSMVNPKAVKQHNKASVDMKNRSIVRNGYPNEEPVIQQNFPYNPLKYRGNLRVVWSGLWIHRSGE